MFEGKKVFLFDMDGLLIDSEKMHLDMWNYVFKKNTKIFMRICLFFF